ncbi:MAG: MATE family efflux transporter [Oscillospiraceae bacterium]|nr:MATE family efflux transporter [Oscillospiraceae bacterium]
MRQQIQLSDHFTYGHLLRFTLPSICMMIFTSIYGMVDGYFISNIVGKTAFASVNLIIPFLQIIGGVGAMLGVGGSALVAKTLGEGDIPKARRYFTMMMYLMLGTSIFFTVVGIAVLRPVAYLFGATEAMIDDVMTYGTICLLFNTALQAQYTFQSYLIVAEKPKLALTVVIAAGVANMVLDYVLMAVFPMKVAGAALATGLSQCVAGVIPFIWFLSRKNKSALRFTKTRFEIKPMLLACGNGASEMMSSVSASVTGILYNLQLMKYAGEDGVAAYGVVMYAAFVFLGVFNGYSQGSSPIMGYHYGAQNHKEMKNVLKRSLILLGAAAVALTAIAMLLARPIATIFVGYDRDLLDMTARAFIICATPFLVMWFNMYTSCFFTALNDGAVSAAISFMRALVLPVLCIIVMPHFWGLDGVWYSLVGSEVLGVGVSLAFMLGMRKKYHY